MAEYCWFLGGCFFSGIDNFWTMEHGLEFLENRRGHMLFLRAVLGGPRFLLQKAFQERTDSVHSLHPTLNHTAVGNQGAVPYFPAHRTNTPHPFSFSVHRVQNQGSRTRGSFPGTTHNNRVVTSQHGKNTVCKGLILSPTLTGQICFPCSRSSTKHFYHTAVCLHCNDKHPVSSLYNQQQSDFTTSQSSLEVV